MKLRSAYFGNKGFSLFTTFAYYSKDGELSKMPITITTEENDKSRMAFMSCVNKVIEHVREKLDRQPSLVHIVSDECTNSFEICVQFAYPFPEKFAIGVELQRSFSWKRAKARIGIDGTINMTAISIDLHPTNILYF